MDMHMGYAALQEPRGERDATGGGEQHYLVQFAPIVKRVARQLASQISGAMDKDDLEQIGLLGLLDALRRYGTPDEKFAGYAATRIRGAILDELRRQDWRPRAVRQDAHRLRDATRKLRRERGREPTEQEVCDLLGLDLLTYREQVIDLHAESMADFDEAMAAEELYHEDTPERQVMMKRCLAQALQGLSETEQRVIQLYYEFDLSLREIAAVLELTEARICQLNKAALKKMRAVLAD